MSGPGESEGFAEACYVAGSTARDLADRLALRAEAGDGRISFAELAHLLVQPGGEDVAEALTAAMADPRLAPQVEALLARLSMVAFEAVAAASSGAVALREAGMFRLRLLEAADAGGASYLLIERMDGADDLPERICAISPDGTCCLSSLPDGADGVTQLMLGPEDALLRAVRDPDSRLYLT